MKIVTGHQPAFLPWVGLLHKVMIADVFIFMDVAKFRKRAFMHRNKIQINDSAHFIGLKLNQKSDQQYCHEVSISSSHKNNLEEVYNKIIFTYKKYKYFKDLDTFLVRSFDKSKNYLVDSIKYLTEGNIDEANAKKPCCGILIEFLRCFVLAYTGAIRLTAYDP